MAKRPETFFGGFLVFLGLVGGAFGGMAFYSYASARTAFTVASWLIGVLWLALCIFLAYAWENRP